MATFAERAKALAATAGEIARLKGAELEAKILKDAKPRLVQTGYDNWNGGTDIYSLLLEVSVPLYAATEDQRERLEKSILERIQQLIRAEVGNAISEVVISPILLDDTRPPLPPEEGAGLRPGDANAESIPSFWEPGPFRLLISHVSDKKESAHRLKDALASFQIAAFVAHDDIEPTREWQAEIETALRTMDALVALVCPGFLGSKWCDQEVGIALGRAKLVIPLRVGADPYGFMGKLQGLQTRGLDAASVASRIFDILIEHDQSYQRMTEALVERLSHSKSWDSSKRTIGLLEKARSLNTSQAGRLLDAIEGNSKVWDAFGVPEKIRALVARIASEGVSLPLT
jgi:hypothetical protein